MTTVQSQDQRKNVRLKGRKESILIHPNGICCIRDISLGGLSFHCDQGDFFYTQWPIEVIYIGTPLHMAGVSVRLIQERMDDVMRFMSKPTKKIGVEFLEVDEENTIVLNKILSYLQEGSSN